ncbi:MULTISPECIES: Asp23/Gls24 family envelope stress response protein [unclassified Streptomyces]|uniref:Asp23/Gls24 family envelope stress response protein n=1 Tax=unclassified Streptomyces TaxID=2593676 RepID=UPI002E2D725F|nr:hypothetical protein [Streptomyces sp. NBC_01429]
MAGDRVAAAERGATVIADRVVAKIAARAAREALDGVPEGGSPPHATVTVHQGSARVRVGVELDYPSDIGARCGAVRSQVAHRVTTLAGMDVREVAVRVERLHSDRSAADRGRIR